MTGILNVTGHLLKGTLVRGIAGLCGGFVLITVVGMLFGYGLLLGLYYLHLLIYYVVPIGMVVGALVVIFKLVRKPAARIGITDRVWLGLLLLGLVVLVLIPQRVIGVERTLTHSARWSIDSSLRSGCLVPVVILSLVEYAHYEEVCSALLYIALASETREIIPVTYKVFYDFGAARGYELTRIDTVEIGSYPTWLGGGDDCGHEPFPACDSSQAKNDRMLYESSWIEERPGET